MRKRREVDGAAGGASGTLIDEVLPEYHIGEKHSIFIEAPPERVFDSLKSAGGYERPVLRLFSVLPVIAGNADAPLFSEEKPIYEGLRSGSWLVLEEQNRELVMADIGTANGPASSMPDTAQEFFTYQLGYNQMKGAVNLRVDPVEGGSQLTTETRMMYGDRTSCRNVGRYLGVMYPGSSLLQIELLKAVKYRVQSGADTASSPSIPSSSPGTTLKGGIS